MVVNEKMRDDDGQSDVWDYSDDETPHDTGEDGEFDVSVTNITTDDEKRSEIDDDEVVGYINYLKKPNPVSPAPPETVRRDPITREKYEAVAYGDDEYDYEKTDEKGEEWDEITCKYEYEKIDWLVSEEDARSLASDLAQFIETETTLVQTVRNHRVTWDIEAVYSTVGQPIPESFCQVSEHELVNKRVRGYERRKNESQAHIRVHAEDAEAVLEGLC